MFTLSWTLDHTGPLARAVEDCAYIFQAMAGHDPSDPASSRSPVRLCRGARGQRPRIAHRRAARLLLPRRRAGISRAFESSMRLRGLGVEVHEVTMPALVVARVHADHGERGVRLPRAGPAGAPGALRRGAAGEAARGGPLTAAEYVQAQRVRTRPREVAKRSSERSTCSPRRPRRRPPAILDGPRSRARLRPQQHRALQPHGTALARLALRVRLMVCRCRYSSRAARSRRPRCCAPGMPTSRRPTGTRGVRRPGG